MKKYTSFRLRVFSKHPTHDMLRRLQLRFPLLTVLRLGSLTVGTLKYQCEINTPEAIKNSASKLLMKECFRKSEVKTADWYTCNKGAFFASGYDEGSYEKSIKELPYPIVAKSHFGSRGEGNYLLKTQEELTNWMKGKDLSHYIFEKYYNYPREYRLHVTQEGCFYTCRKMLKEDTPDEKRWYRNDSNSVWIKEENPSFDKPVNWNEIEAECVKGLKAVGLDVGAFDVKVQSAKNKDGVKRDKVDFIVLESNSAPSFGDVTLEKYKEQLPKIISFKTTIK